MTLSICIIKSHPINRIRDTRSIQPTFKYIGMTRLQRERPGTKCPIVYHFQVAVGQRAHDLGGG